MTENVEPLITKYRPETFDDVVGHTTIVKTLKNILDEGKSKAFLFSGQSGLGKTTLARIAANYICDGEATAANIIEVDAATNTGAEATRELAASLNYKALGKHPIKVCIVDEVHRLSSAAFSSLLKPIEEPPSHVYWALCTTELGKIPNTIKTRCTKFDLKPLKEEYLLRLLSCVADEEELDTPDEVLEIISENSDGSPRQALANLEVCAYCETANEALNVMRSAGQTQEAIELARLLLARQGRNWSATLKILNNMKEMEPESIRIMITRYISAALLKTKKEQEAKRMLIILDSFSEQYRQTDGFGPLLLSLGRAFGLDED